jgi:hypothetical protein
MRRYLIAAFVAEVVGFIPISAYTAYYDISTSKRERQVYDSMPHNNPASILFIDSVSKKLYKEFPVVFGDPVREVAVQSA